jgi:hypothetical protein
VRARGLVVGRIFTVNPTRVGSPWMWTLIFPHHAGRSPTPRLRGCTRSRHGGIRQELAVPGLMKTIFAFARRASDKNKSRKESALI